MTPMFRIGTSVSGGQGPRLALRSLAPTAIQAGEHGDHETGVHVDRTLQHHGAPAFVTSVHAGTLTFVIDDYHRSEVPIGMSKGPSRPASARSFGPVDCLTGRMRVPTMGPGKAAGSRRSPLSAAGRHVIERTTQIEAGCYA